VIVVDSWSIERSNVAEIAQGEPIAVSPVTVHALTAGQGFDMNARRVLQAAGYAPVTALPAPTAWPADAFRPAQSI
jgi:cyanophycinase